MNRFRGFLLHLCVICSFVCIIARVLDWYNPYMDFSGHLFWIQNTMYAGIVLLAVTKTHKSLKGKKYNGKQWFAVAKQRYA